MKSLLNKHPLVCFFALSFGLSWLFWAPVIAAGQDRAAWVTVFHILGGHGPLFACLMVVSLAATREDRRDFYRSLLNWRLPVRWYIVFLLAPLALLAVYYLALVLMAGTLEGVTGLPPWWLYPVMFLGMSLVGGGLEEPAWRGYALPRLLDRYSPLTATLVLGIVWMVWHLPLFFAASVSQTHIPFGLFTVNGLALSVIFTWGYLYTKGSILMAVILHGGLNAALNWYPMQGGTVEPFLPIAIVTSAIAVLLILFSPQFRQGIQKPNPPIKL
jgi:membrane protease YdiL (CAAX protease family)